MTDVRRLLAVAALAGGALLAACEDGLIRPAAPAGPAAVRIAAALTFASGGPAEAYQKLDQLSVRFVAGTEERLASVLPFDPGAAVTVVSLQVPLEDLTESVQIQLELRAGGQAVFRGSAETELSAGGTSEVEIPITPVVNAVTCAGPPFPIAVYHAARRLTAAALFATGDTVTGASFAWSSANPAVATVTQAGDVTGLQDGSAQINCSYQSFTSNRVVQVFAVVASLQLQPAEDTVAVGATAAFTAIRRDSLGNPISGPRQTAWTSSNDAVATVSATGVASGVAPGRVTITATSGGGGGTAALLVIGPPIVRTGSGVPTGAGATLSGGVNPQGLAAQAWFEWSNSPTLSNAQRTATQQLPGGTQAEIPITADLTGLAPGVTYYFRLAASNTTGTAYGQILSFRANSPPVATTLAATTAGALVTLRGTVNAGGLATSTWFEYGLSPALSDATATASQNIGAGTTDNQVSAPLGGLSGGRIYYFRVAASNQLGTTRGAILSFVAPLAPTAITLQPTGITAGGATLQGSVNPNGYATTAWFEWGSGVAPSSFNLTAAQALGSGTVSLPVSQGLGGLTAGASYSYRVVAASAVDTTRGALTTFATVPPPTAITLPSYYYNFGQGNVSYLSGQITPQPVDTEVWFEYSTTSPSLATYSSTAVQIMPVGGQEGGYDFWDSVPGVVYFRAVARHAGGTSRGAILRTQLLIIG